MLAKVCYPVIYNIKTLIISYCESFTQKWGWLRLVDMVSEATRDRWSSVFEMTAIEFLNIVCYTIDKREKDKEDQEQWKRTH